MEEEKWKEEKLYGTYCTHLTLHSAPYRLFLANVIVITCKQATL